MASLWHCSHSSNIHTDSAFKWQKAVHFNEGHPRFRLWFKSWDKKSGTSISISEHQLFWSRCALRCLLDQESGLSVDEAKERAIAPCGIGWSYYESLHLNFREDKKEEVAIAGMLAMKPQVLVLDEPTAGLDQRTGWILDRVARAWERIPDDGGSCLSGMEDVAKYVSRLMNAGQGFDGTQEVFKHYKERKGGLSAPQITCCAGIKVEGVPIDERDWCQKQLCHLLI